MGCEMKVAPKAVPALWSLLRDKRAAHCGQLNALIMCTQLCISNSFRKSVQLPSFDTKTQIIWMAGGIIQCMCHKIHMYSMKLKRQWRKYILPASKKWFLRLVLGVDLVLSDSLWEWETNKITKPKHGVGNFLTITSPLPTKWLHSQTT